MKRSGRMFWQLLTVFSLITIVSSASLSAKRYTGKSSNDAMQTCTKPNTRNKTNDLLYERYVKEDSEVAWHTTAAQVMYTNPPNAIYKKSAILSRKPKFPSHGRRLRTKMEEIKRIELERLRKLIEKKAKLNEDIKLLTTNGDEQHWKINDIKLRMIELDEVNNLIKRVNKNLDEVDRQRRVQFKVLEMEKQFEQEMLLKDSKKNARKLKELKSKESKEQPMTTERPHHPGNKAHLEEVWVKQDHMDKNDFEPKKFFAIHDVDNNGFWDQNEVKALFIKELDKMYSRSKQNKRVRSEDMERMREHVFKETDTNRDGLISYSEFLNRTKQENFKSDPGWQSIGEKPVYTKEEYEQFKQRRAQDASNVSVTNMVRGN